ncbi:tellurite resistance TerB C-terminal domain-containing protein [Leptolyngbya sp. AN03gr2]|uniref:tellurite resistance TerB C-terminal domain-containing protein n=1 Tax=unclassified Leptolyngbya TaxID=2650499 RepID=UPI003D315EDF
MFKSRLMLSLVAFSVSFVISLLITRDFTRSLISGAVTLFASLVGAAFSENQYRQSLYRRSEELTTHIRSLQRKRAEAYESLVLITQERDRISNSLNSLQTQLRNLQVQSANLWQQKEELSWNLTSPQASPTNQIYVLQVKLQELEQKEAELNKSLSATLSAKQRAELGLKTTQAQLNQFQAQLAEQQSQKVELAKEVNALLSQKQQLDIQLTTLQPKVKELEKYRSELSQFLETAEPKRKQVESSSKSLQGAIENLQTQISSLQGELGQLEHQILERRQQKEVLDQELSTLRRELEPDAEAEAYSEWKIFLSQLQQPEFEALNAIAHQSNPNASLKQIAEANLTMPELLIDAINERSIETIGDFVIDPTPGTAPSIAPEYLETVRQLLARS